MFQIKRAAKVTIFRNYVAFNSIKRTRNVFRLVSFALFYRQTGDPSLANSEYTQRMTHELGLDVIPFQLWNPDSSVQEVGHLESGHLCCLCRR